MDVYQDEEWRILKCVEECAKKLMIRARLGRRMEGKSHTAKKGFWVRDS